MERAHEVREIAEANLERDLRDCWGSVSEQARRMSKPAAHQVLMWCHSENRCEQTKKVERAHANFIRNSLKIEKFVRVCFNQEGRLHRAPAIACRRRCSSVRSTGRNLDEAGGQAHAHLIGAQITTALDACLSQLANDHELG
jgi:hypothetical protein